MCRNNNENATNTISIKQSSSNESLTSVPRVPRRRPRETKLNEYKKKEEELSMRIQKLLLISQVSVVLFIFTTFSLSAIICFIIAAAASILAGIVTYKWILIKINKKGLLYFLPDIAQTYLTKKTLHEIIKETAPTGKAQ